MNKNLTLSIPRPCSEKWATLTKTSEGGYCGSCCKVVIDLSHKSDKEIVAFFTQRSSTVCARLRVNQLKTFTPIARPAKATLGLAWLKAGFVSLLLMVIDKQAYSQTKVGKTVITVNQSSESLPENRVTKAAKHVIKGVVKSEEDGLALPGVYVTLKGTETGTVTDADGQFELNKKREGDILVFSFIGFRSKEYVVAKEPVSDLAIVMKLDMELMGEVAIGGAYQPEPSRIKKLWNQLNPDYALEY